MEVAENGDIVTGKSQENGKRNGWRNGFSGLKISL
jgi:hypothetical protein